MHKLLSHSPNIISDFNNSHGLKQISEGLEENNKLISRFRESWSKKTWFQDNLHDVSSDGFPK